MKSINLFSLILTCSFIALFTCQVSAQLDEIPYPDRILDRVVDKLETVQDDMDDAKLTDLKTEKGSDNDLIDLMDKFDLMNDYIVEELEEIKEVKNIDIWEHADNITLSELRDIDREIEFINDRGQELVVIEKKAVRMAEDLVMKYKQDEKNTRDSGGRDSDARNVDERNSDTKDPRNNETKDYLADVANDLEILLEKVDPIKGDINDSKMKIMEMIKR